MPLFYSPLGPSMSSAHRHPEQTPIVIHNELAGRERTRRELSAQGQGLEGPFSTLAAKSRENRGKNRYTDIAPYDRTRVKVGGEEGPGGYLNASWVEEVDGGRRWIASQAPLPSTVATFFASFLAPGPSSPHLIVQLTNFIERGIQKAEPYLPTSSSPLLKFSGAGGLEVRWLGTENRPEEGCEITDLEISMDGVEAQRVVKRVKHMWFQGWPDKGVPKEVEELMKFLKLVEEMNALFPSDDVNSSLGPPILVHCSAGVGRTGSFISIASLLRLLPLHHSEPFPTPPQSSLGPLSKDVKGEPLAIVIDYCREQRLMMVETKEQVDLVWRCTSHAGGV